VFTPLMGTDDVPDPEADAEEAPDGADRDPSSTTLSVPSLPKISKVAEGPDVGAAGDVIATPINDERVSIEGLQLCTLHF